MFQWQKTFLAWPDWVKMLILVLLMVTTITVAVGLLAWLVSLLPF